MTNSRRVNEEISNMKIVTTEKDYTMLKEFCLILSVVIIITMVVVNVI